MEILTLTRLCCVMTVAVISPLAWAQDESVEYAIKATYLNKFVPFIEWPAPSLPASTINLCVVGSDPVTTFIDQTANDQRVGDRRIVVRHLAKVTSSSNCQVMYIGRDEAHATLPLVRGQPILTITNDTKNGDRGIINFIVTDNRVRFDIDNQTAKECGIQINPKLLSLAVPRS